MSNVIHLLAQFRDIERPLFSVANSTQEFWALLITKGGVRGHLGSEFVSLHMEERWFQIFSSPFMKTVIVLGQTHMSRRKYK
jgi:hypothetical protein